MKAERREIRISVPTVALEEICRRYGVSELAFFGSVLRDDFAPESDVDVLVRLLPGVTPSLLDLAGLHLALEDLFGRKVDLTDRRGIRPLLAEEILSSRRIVYVAA